MKNPLCGIAEPIEASTVQWCADNIYISPRIPTARPGAWRSDNVAALCAPGGPLAALDDPTVETVVVAKGSQTALTTTAYCWLAKCMTLDPGSALIVMNSTQDARDKSAETWRPIWEDSPHLRGLISENRKRDWTKLYQLLNRSPVYWMGANSAGRLASKPIRRLILDEVDKYPERFKTDKKTSREAGAAALAEQRVKTFRQSGLAKILVFSTPTTEHGEVWRRFEQGDMRKFYVLCPKCGTAQLMVWQHFRLDMELAAKNPSEAVAACHYECPHCKAKWTDHDRWAAIDKGEWRATTKAKDPKCASFHLPSWCSKMVTHVYLAQQWIKTQESSSSLQDFINSECGEPFAQYEAVVRVGQFVNLEGGYSEGELFADVEPYRALYADCDAWVFGGVDVQKGYLMAVFRQFVAGGDSALVWSGDVATFEALDELAAKYNAQFVLIDNRYRTHEVNLWCSAHSGYIPTQGVTRRGRMLFSVEALNISEGKRGQRYGAEIEFLRHDPDMLKDMLKDRIEKKSGVPLWLVPRGYSTNREYCAQMTAEKCINGKWQAIPAGRPNHYWDAEALCLLASERFRVREGGQATEQTEAQTQNDNG